MKFILSLSCFLLATLNSQLPTFAQGGLTPPGAPTPTMKSLDQVYAKLDSRTAITNAATGYTISVSGSYYLTTNLTVSSGNGITIAANGVTLDLNGFTISSPAASPTGYGILLNGPLSDITIVNGHIRSGVTNNGSGVYGGSGFGYGVYYSGGLPANVVVSKVSVAGVLNSGIYIGSGNSTVVEACTVTTAGGSGIFATTIKGSVAIDCGAAAISCNQVSDSRGVSTGGYGIYASATAINCYGQSSSNYGLFAYSALNCYGQSVSSYGLYAIYVAQNCYGFSNSSYGLSAPTAQNCLGESNSSIGLSASSALNCRGAGYGSGAGVSAYVANSCYGYSTSGTGLTATYGNFCFGNSVSVFNKYNMP